MSERCIPEHTTGMQRPLTAEDLRNSVTGQAFLARVSKIAFSGRLQYVSDSVKPEHVEHNNDVFFQSLLFLDMEQRSEPPSQEKPSEVAIAEMDAHWDALQVLAKKHGLLAVFQRAEFGLMQTTRPQYRSLGLVAKTEPKPSYAINYADTHYKVWSQKLP